MDPAALESLYRSYSAELLGSLRRRFPWSPDVVEDAVQHAFLQLQGADPVPDEPRAWLRTVARRHVLDRLRADGKLVGDDETIDALPAGTAGTPGTTTEMVTPTLVQRALLKLTTRAQRLLRGKYEEGRSYDTLARQERVAKSGMGRILDRARERLRRAVEELRGARRDGQE